MPMPAVSAFRFAPEAPLETTKPVHAWPVQDVQFNSMENLPPPFAHSVRLPAALVSTLATAPHAKVQPQWPSTTCATQIATQLTFTPSMVLAGPPVPAVLILPIQMWSVRPVLLSATDAQAQQQHVQVAQPATIITTPVCLFVHPVSMVTLPLWCVWIAPRTPLMLVPTPLALKHHIQSKTSSLSSLSSLIRMLLSRRTFKISSIST